MTTNVTITNAGPSVVQVTRGPYAPPMEPHTELLATLKQGQSTTQSISTGFHLRVTELPSP